MARIKEVSVKKKKTTITFEFEHAGEIHESKSKIDTELYEGLSERELKKHIGVRANHERNKIDNSRTKAKEEEQGKKSKVLKIKESAKVEKGLEQQPDLEEEPNK